MICLKDLPNGRFFRLHCRPETVYRKEWNIFQDTWGIKAYVVYKRVDGVWLEIYTRKFNIEYFNQSLLVEPVLAITEIYEDGGLDGSSTP